MKTRHRLLLALTTVALVTSLIVAVGAVRVVRHTVQDRFVDRIRSETALLASQLEQFRPIDLQAFATQAAQSLGVRVTLVAADGTIAADSAKERDELAQMENHSNRSEIVDAGLRGTGTSVRMSDTTRLEYLYLARTVENVEDVRFVRIAVPSNQISLAQARHVWSIVPLVLIALLLIVGLGYAAVRRISRPLERITADIERVAQGSFDHELQESGGEEVRRLVGSVRRMQSALLEKIGEVDTERKVLSSVISGMREGLALVGADRRVRLTNDSLRAILELDFDPRGYLLAEVARHPEIIADVETAFSGSGPIVESTVRFASSDRVFELHVTPLRAQVGGSEASEVLVLLFDVTRLERLEAVRRDFVADVSHELRTPLTSIKAFVENLLEGGLEEPENARRFLEIVQKHSERMSELIEDLTDLSQIETEGVPLELRPIDAAEVCTEVEEPLRPLADERNVRIVVDFPSPLSVVADRKRLAQMLTNLVHNAVKFSRAGGEVVLRGSSERGRPTIRVIDTGIGIPESARERIFNRFYQVDQGRSPDTRGSGLGLAIVKHLMRLHGGHVRVESELGVGSTFILEFPDASQLVAQA